AARGRAAARPHRARGHLPGPDDGAHGARVRAGRAVDALGGPRADAHADPRAGVGLRLRSGHQHRRRLHPAHPPQDRRHRPGRARRLADRGGARRRLPFPAAALTPPMRSFRTRIFVVTALTVTLVLLGAGLLAGTSFERDERHRLDERLCDEARRLAGPLPADAIAQLEPDIAAKLHVPSAALLLSAEGPDGSD